MGREYFVGGEINHNYRGSKVLVVTKQGGRTADLRDFGSDRLFEVTGFPEALSHPVERIYAGVNSGGKIDEIISGLNSGEMSLEDVDRTLVVPYLLGQRKEERRDPAMVNPSTASGA